MKLKLDAEGHAVLQDGKPVYVYDDGKEVAFDAPGTVAKISQLNGEAKSHRERAETAEKTLKTFDGIEDPVAAKKAIGIVKNLDDKKLVDAGEVETVRAEAIKAVEEKYAPLLKERDTLQAALISEKIGGSFARSKFISEKMAIPSDIAEAAFGQHFKLEGDQVVSYDKGGNKIFSRERPGEVAGFDEAMDILVSEYPRKDSILKSSGASGGGAAGAGGGKPDEKSLKRASFEALSPDDRMAHVKAGGEIKD